MIKLFTFSGVDMRPVKIFTFITLAAVFTACDAPRFNPLDPGAGNYEIRYMTTVTVNRISSPDEPIGDALIGIQNLDLYGKTNVNGMVQWRHDPVDSLILTANSAGYFPDTVTFRRVEEVNKLEMSLNAKPVMDSVKFYSIRDIAGNITYLSTDVKITDPDGIQDVSAVYLYAPQKQYTDTLMFNPENGNFTGRFNTNRIAPGFNSYELPEINFSLVVKNTATDSLITSGWVVRRVIDADLRLLLPNSAQPVVGIPEFSWERVELTYPFSYYIILFKLNGNVQRIGRFGPVSSEKNTFILDDPDVLAELVNGSYLWMLQVEDSRGNICQSAVINFQYYRQ